MKKKMKKLIYFVAAFAAVATFYSCSSDDVLDDIQQPSDVEEVQGKPLTVRVNGEALTRGEYASAITGFKMTGLANGNYGTEWFKDGAFTKDGSWTNNLAADKKSWPSTTAKYDFFAASEDGAAASVSTSTLTDGKISFDYTVPTDLASQKDLLVATNIGAASTDNDGEVSLNFQHALSGIKLLARLAFVDWNGSIYTNSGISDVVDEYDDFHYGYYIEIAKVEIYGFKTKGTFTFGSATSTNTKGAWESGSWSAQAEPAVFVLDYSTSPLVYIVEAQAGITNDTEAAAYTHVDLLGGTSSVPKMTMVVPQTTTAWVPSATCPTDGSASYIKLHMKMAYYCPVSKAQELKQQYLEEGDTETADYYQQIIDDNGCMGNALESWPLSEGNYYYPIPTKEFSANKTYTLRLLLNRLYKTGGTKAFSGASFNG